MNIYDLDFTNGRFEFNPIIMKLNILLNGFTGPIRSFSGETFYSEDNPPPGWKKYSK